MHTVSTRPEPARGCDQSAMVARLDAEIIERLEARPRRLPTFADWLYDLLDRIEKHAAFLMVRAEARGLHASDFRGVTDLGSVLNAVAEYPVEGDATDEAIDAGIACLHDAVSLAKHGAEMDLDGTRGPTWLQCREVEESDLRSLVRALADLELLRRAARNGQMQAADALAYAADTLAASPGHPPHTGAC